jgi:hypothetical protein
VLLGQSGLYLLNRVEFAGKDQNFFAEARLLLGDIFLCGFPFSARDSSLGGNSMMTQRRLMVVRCNPINSANTQHNTQSVKLPYMSCSRMRDTDSSELIVGQSLRRIAFVGLLLFAR